VEGKFLSATTPTYIIVFVCLSASTDGKKTRAKQTENQSKNASHTQSKNLDPNSKGEASIVLCSSSQGLRKQKKTKRKKNSRRTEGKRLRGGGRENSPGVLELLLSPASSNRQVRLSCYLHFCSFDLREENRAKVTRGLNHACLQPGRVTGLGQ
jgi:hypothetical protein